MIPPYYKRYNLNKLAYSNIWGKKAWLRLLCNRSRRHCASRGGAVRLFEVLGGAVLRPTPLEPPYSNRGVMKM